MKYLVLVVAILFLNGCDYKKVDEGEAKSVPAMKCGAGKCGANMFDGNAGLVKKKKNILSQMREDDTRRDCVKKAKTTKKAYDCVRDPNGKKMIMKCGAGKCGAAMTQEKPKAQPVMKCGPGKCGSSMK